MPLRISEESPPVFLRALRIAERMLSASCLSVSPSMSLYVESSAKRDLSVANNPTRSRNFCFLVSLGCEFTASRASEPERPRPGTREVEVGVGRSSHVSQAIRDRSQVTKTK
jgi:hypothetical protein